ncbi:protein FAR-RED IMPAIRED RESPONSE 1-like [Carex rostrata]
MNNVKPAGVLTDQCPSIELGVKHVFGEETVHRYCSWHILHKLPTKWENVGNKSEKTKWVKSVVYDSQTRQEFEQKWLSLMVKVGKQNDAWFKGIYAMRERWVPAFLSTQFWAGMTTTQRVESMNAFLNAYLTRRESLKHFVSSFEEALGNIWQRENTADHDSKFRAHKVNSELPMEYQYRSFIQENIKRIVLYL